MKNKLQKVGLAVTSAAVGLSLVVNQAYAQVKLGNMLNPEGFTGGNLGYTELVKALVNLVFVVAAALTFFYLIFGAINWITSGGDKGKVEAARNKITAAVIGLLILAATWGVFSLLLQLFFNNDVNNIDVPILKGTGKPPTTTTK